MLSQCLREMARYNRWQNRNLYERLAGLEDARRKADTGLFFGSIHGTLNHLLLADRIWLGRFTGVPFHARSLDQELHGDFAELARARTETDEQIVRFTDTLEDGRLAGDLEYVTMTTGQARRQPLARCLMHFFNHQTHHRGQVTAAMSGFGLDFGVTDLAFLPAEELTR